MTDERELERHQKILEAIKNATDRSELPAVGISTISSFLATNAYFGKEKISQSEFKEVVDNIIKYGIPYAPEVRKSFIKTLVRNYPNVSDEIIEKYNQIFRSPRIGNLIVEISEKNKKLDYFDKEEHLEQHKETLKEIRYAHEIKDLPKVGLGELNKKILSAVNSNDFVKTIKTSEFKELTKAYIEERSFKEIEEIVIKMCSKYNLNDTEKEHMQLQIMESLLQDETIEYTVKEIQLKEARKIEIYRENHEETMENIKNATRISQLPPNLTTSTLTSYLLGNTTIYSRDNRIKSEDLKELTRLLFEHKDWDDEEVIEEIERITKEKYPEKEDAFDLLYTKLSELPRTNYLIKEIEYSAERQQEFIGRSCSNVNVYFIPNEKSPIEGGKFYNCYINRVDNLNLEELLPLDLEEIVPPQMDIDSVEWYVQENYDPTFKAAGGIILNRDETIGKVNVFKPNDGKVGVDPEDKKKIDESNSLDNEIQEKKEILASLDDEIKVKTRKAQEVALLIDGILIEHENEMLQLQKRTAERIAELKREVSNIEFPEEKGRGSK